MLQTQQESERKKIKCPQCPNDAPEILKKNLNRHLRNVHDDKQEQERLRREREKRKRVEEDEKIRSKQILEEAKRKFEELKRKEKELIEQQKAQRERAEREFKRLEEERKAHNTEQLRQELMQRQMDARNRLQQIIRDQERIINLHESRLGMQNE